MINDFDMSQLAFGAATRARIDANSAQQEADIERQRARTAEAALRNVTTDADLERKVRGLGIEKERLLSSVQYMQGRLDQRDASIIERDKIIYEWMHSNEAFRRLAKQYGKVLGISDDQVQKDYVDQVVNLEEEDPKFSNTGLGKKLLR